MRTLALDIGSHTGFAVFDGSLKLSGTWLLADKNALAEAKKTGLERRLDIRFKRLFELVSEAFDEFQIERVIFEDVQFQSSQAQTQLWSRLSAAVWAAALTSPIEIEVQCVPVGTLKLFATGNGGADKSMMAEALYRMFPECYHMRMEPNPNYNPKKKKSQTHVNVLTKVSANTDMGDDEVDAIWLGMFGQSVDRGERNFLSIWEKKKEARKQKLAKKKLKKQVL